VCGGGEIEAIIQVLEGATMPGVDVYDQQAIAGRNADIRVRRALPPIEHFGILRRRTLHAILCAWMLARAAILLVATGASSCGGDGVYRDDAPVALRKLVICYPIVQEKAADKEKRGKVILFL